MNTYLCVLRMLPPLLLLGLSGCAVTGKTSAKPNTAAATTVSAPASSPAADDNFDYVPEQKVNDPLHGFNRTMFKFNDGLTTYVFRPVAKGYVKVVPRPARTGIKNFFDNVKFPVRFVGALLQGKFVRCAQETGKFVVNTTVGVGGLIRVSDHVSGLDSVPAEDIGQALGVWGIPAGPYLVLPVFGSTDLRDLVGFAGDTVAHPISWYAVGIVDERFISEAAKYSLTGLAGVNDLPETVEEYDEMKASAVDPYIATRDGYLSYRAAAVKQ
ncbi:MAG TPA: VacJ family lipoprotein [Chthoniobacterales bacterium]